MKSVKLPDGTNFVTDWSDKDIIEILRRCCGDEIGNEIADELIEHRKNNIYEELKFNSDFEWIEGENENLRNCINEIESTLQQYEYKIERGNEAFSRKRVFKIFEAIHTEIKNAL